MYLIFILNRNDILPTEDVAFLQEYEWLYKTTNHSPTSVKNKHKKWPPTLPALHNIYIVPWIEG